MKKLSTILAETEQRVMESAKIILETDTLSDDVLKATVYNYNFLLKVCFASDLDLAEDLVDILL